MNQAEFLTIIAKKRRAIEFSFASHWLKNCGEIFNPITKGSNRNHAVVFDTVI